MNKCIQCNLEIVDDTMICPLCNNVLERTNEYQPKEPMYPDVKIHAKAFQTIGRIYVFAAIFCECILILINYLTYSGSLWSVITGGCFFYLFITLKYSLDNGNSAHTMKIMVQAIALAALTVLIDHIVGYKGWSVNYAIPCIIILVDIAILILMLVNVMDWQAYILLQIFMVVSSLVLLVFFFLDFTTQPVLTFVSVGVSIVLFVGTIIFGDKRAKNELKRRFYI